MQITFKEYAARWFETAQLAYNTRARCEILLGRINKAIGDTPLDEITAYQLESFYKGLSSDGVKYNGRYVKITGKKRISAERLAALCGIGRCAAQRALAGMRIERKTAEKIAAKLDIDFQNIESPGLDSNTIRHHHRLITIILNKAKRERLITFNVATEAIKAPRVRRKEARFLDEAEAVNAVELLLSERDSRIRLSIMLLFYTGMRRGELCGLQWGDVGERKIKIRRAVEYRKGASSNECETKNPSSVRDIYLPDIVLKELSEYRADWLKYKEYRGKDWNAPGWLFFQKNGNAVYPGTINYWLRKFIKKNGLKQFTPHSLRHTFITLQLYAKTDLKTLQSITGHSQASTLLDIYAHTLNKALEEASENLNRILTPKFPIKPYNCPGTELNRRHADFQGF